MGLDQLEKIAFGRLQDFCTFYKRLIGIGLTPEDVVEFVERKKKETKDVAETIRLVHRRRCPDCNNLMRFAAVNHSPSTQTGDDSTYVWVCRKCLKEIWTKDKLKTVLEKLKEEV